MIIKRAHGLADVRKLDGGTYVMSIWIDEEFRGRGHGERFMRYILKTHPRPVYLLASGELGGDVARLRKFYNRFGFIEEKRPRNSPIPFNYNMVLY